MLDLCIKVSKGEEIWNLKTNKCDVLYLALEDTYSRLQKRLFNDKLKYELCKQHNIEIIYYFPKRFMKHNISFYNDKKCFHNINDLRKYIDSL